MSDVQKNGKRVQKKIIRTNTLLKLAKKKSSHPQKNVAETGEDLSLYSFADLTN